jgi:hypothetical protein
MRASGLPQIGAGEAGFHAVFCASADGRNALFNDLGTNTEHSCALFFQASGNAALLAKKAAENQRFRKGLKGLVTLLARENSRRKSVSVHRIFRKTVAVRLRINSLVSEIEQCEKNQQVPSHIAGKVEALTLRTPVRSAAFSCEPARLVTRNAKASVEFAAFLRKSADAPSISTNF